MTSQADIKWFAEYRRDQAVLARYGRRGTHLLAEFLGLGTLVSETGHAPRFESAAGADQRAVDKLKASIVGALARHIEGKVTLHGSSVAFDERAIAIVGPSHAGKSTLAAAACAERSAQLVADDTVAIELPTAPALPITVVPTQKFAWLRSDAIRALGLGEETDEKVAVSLPVTGASRLRLAGVVALTYDSASCVPALRRVRGREAFAFLAQSAIRLVVDEPAFQLREFEQFSGIVRDCPVYELRRAKGLQSLPSAVDIIRDIATGRASSEYQDHAF